MMRQLGGIWGLAVALQQKPLWARIALGALLVGLLAPLILALTTASASGDDCNPDEDPECDAANYSLYNLASNAASYFGNENSPGQYRDGELAEGSDDAGVIHTRWHDVTQWPAAAGSLLGYADPEFSFSFEWLISDLSGSSQSMSYSSLVDEDASGNASNTYSGLLNYGYFGAANASLGLDSMTGDFLADIMNKVGGGIIWLLYPLSILASALFTVVIGILKLLNPFLWFHSAIRAINPEFADGMVGAAPVDPNAWYSGLADFISTWYKTLTEISWQVLVPIFIAFLLLGMLLFKKMNRGRAIKRLAVRMLFIGLGVPLLGSMYTGVLNQFDANWAGQSAGPTKVVLSTYVDFEAWMMNDRLMIPEDANISWNPEEGTAFNSAVMQVRDTALAINAQAHGDIYSGLSPSPPSYSDDEAWSDNLTLDDSTPADSQSVFGTLDIISRFIDGAKVPASDFESTVKSTITRLDESPQTKADWFTNTDGEGGYGSSERFGEESGVPPNENPLIAPGGDVGETGLDAGTDDGDEGARWFRSTGVSPGCGHEVWVDGKPAPCNLSPLAAYNYLNTKFDTAGMTFYSSNKATSGLTREQHYSVSQVGTGPAKFMYWANAVVLLGSIALIGIWYAIGMLVGAVRRTFSLVAAIPFATLGAMASISKVIVYTVALILEVLVTLFLFSFVSEFLVSIPQIIETPMAAFFSADSAFSNSLVIGAIMVVLATAISTLLIIGVTFTLLKLRKTVLKALDEAVTKLIDHFLETNTTTPGGGSPRGPGALPSMARGAAQGAGAGMTNRAMGGGASGPTGQPTKGGPQGGRTRPTNVGGTNAPAPKTGTATIERGPDSGGLIPNTDQTSRRTPADAEQGVDPRGLNSGEMKGSALQLGGAPRRASPQDDKSTAQQLAGQGGLTDFGYTDASGRPIAAPASSAPAPSAPASGTTPSTLGRFSGATSADGGSGGHVTTSGTGGGPVGGAPRATGTSATRTSAAGTAAAGAAAATGPRSAPSAGPQTGARARAGDGPRGAGGRAASPAPGTPASTSQGSGKVLRARPAQIVPRSNAVPAADQATPQAAAAPSARPTPSPLPSRRPSTAPQPSLQREPSAAAPQPATAVPAPPRMSPGRPSASRVSNPVPTPPPAAARPVPTRAAVPARPPAPVPPAHAMPPASTPAQPPTAAPRPTATPAPAPLTRRAARDRRR